MITDVNSSVVNVAPVQELIPGLDRGNSDEAEIPRLLRSFRHFIILAFLGSVFLPPLAYLSSPSSGGVISSLGEFYLKVGLYGVSALAAIVGLYLLLLRIEPYLLKESLDQAAFLETIPDRSLSIAIAASAALSLFLELAVIRWQGSIFEFFAFYKNYGLLACFAGLGLGYALSRNEEGIPLSLTLCLLAWQFGLLMFLRFGLPRPSVSLAPSPFLEQLSMGLQTSTSNQSRAVYLLLTVVFLLTALAFIPLGQVCGKLMEKTSQLSAYGLNLGGSLLGVSLMFLASWLWTPPVVWFGACFLALLFFFVRTRTTLLVGGGLALLSVIILALPVNPLWKKDYSPYQMLVIGS